VSQQQVRGSIDFVDHCIKGWAYAPGVPHLWVVLVVDGREVALGHANLYRPDLAQAGIGDGAHGFFFPYPDWVADGETHWVNVRLFGGRWTLQSLDRPVRFDIDRSGRKFFFLHLPKCGGTSLRNALEAKFAPWELLPDPLMMQAWIWEYPLARILLASAETTRARARFLRGHYHYELRRVLGESCQVITVLRDPVKRTISHLGQLRRDDPRFKGRPLREILRRLGPWELNDIQTRFLGGRYLENHPGRLLPRFLENEMPQGECDGGECLGLALERLHEVEFLGVYEQLGDFVCSTFEALGWTPPELPKLNVTESEPDEEEAALREEILPHVQLDRILYEEAVKLLLSRRAATQG
jgi:hypothetical protein